MKRLHLEALRPVCPYCKSTSGTVHPLELAWVEDESDGDVLAGALECTSPSCRAEYPIVDGLPLLVPDPRTYIEENFFSLLLREDLPASLESRIGEGCGPGSAYDSLRVHLSSYGWDHYGDLDPAYRRGVPGAASAKGPTAVPGAPFATGPMADAEPSSVAEPGSIVRVLDRVLALGTSPDPEGPTIDLGCSVGRVSFELARRTRGLVLGVDTNATMLRMARRILAGGRVRYPLRRVGLVYEERAFAVDLPGADRVDFWIADAGALPFDTGAIADVVALNVIDSVPSPLDLLRSTFSCLRAGGRAYLASPYDWSGAVTLPAAWIGGHSPRATGGGESAPVLRALLTEGAHAASLPEAEVEAEADDVAWQVRMHSRSVVRYALHAVVARKRPIEPSSAS